MKSKQIKSVKKVKNFTKPKLLPKISQDYEINIDKFKELLKMKKFGEAMEFLERLSKKETG